jgi:hypothetical protein
MISFRLGLGWRVVVQFAVNKKEVELRSTDSRGRLSPHEHFANEGAAGKLRVLERELN